MKQKLSTLDWTAWVLLMLGALNWGLYGLFKFDGIQVLLGTSPQLAQGMYVLVGISGVYWLYKTLILKQ